MTAAPTTRLCLLVTAAVLALPSRAQTGTAAPAREAVEAAARQQREAVEAAGRAGGRMQAAIARQLEAVKAQEHLRPSPLPAPLVHADLWAPPQDGCGLLPGEQSESLVGEAARREGLSEGLLRALIEQESGYHPCAVSPKGALGLMQLMPETAAGLGLEDPFNPRENVHAGARLLKQLLARYGGDLSLALGAYNAGPARVDEAGGIPAIPETVNYVHQILGRLEDRGAPARAGASEVTRPSAPSR